MRVRTRQRRRSFLGAFAPRAGAEVVNGEDDFAAGPLKLLDDDVLIDELSGETIRRELFIAYLAESPHRRRECRASAS
jgi:hypothetical protein